jgi:molecular chaperone Hsp33
MRRPDSERMAEARHNDLIHRFLLERAGVRGAIVRLAGAWNAVCNQGPYPAPIQRFLGETLAASVLFTGHIKSGTSLSIQLRAEGPMTSLYAECSADGEVRGLAHWHEPLPEVLQLGQLKAPAHLAITLEQRSGQRYQGMVPLQSATLDEAFECYFAQSEQLPTRVRLAADHDHSTGIVLQHLPAEGGVATPLDPDGWTRANALLDTLTREELLELDPASVLHRLFHEERVRLFRARPLRFGCRCSQDKVEQVLRHLGRDEAAQAVQEQGQLEVTCEFCNRQYRFDRVDLERVFATASSPPAPSTRQ